MTQLWLHWKPLQPRNGSSSSASFCYYGWSPGCSRVAADLKADAAQARTMESKPSSSAPSGASRTPRIRLSACRG